MTNTTNNKTSPRQFSDLNISAGLKLGIEELGYLSPTQFQQGVFEGASLGKNVVGQGRSSYGKSLAFSMPIVAKIDPASQTLQALIICESTKQSDLASKECRTLGRHLNITVGHGLAGTTGAMPHILVVAHEDLPKVIEACDFSFLNTIFFDGLSQNNTKTALDLLRPFLTEDIQILIFGETTLSAFENGAQKYINNAIFVDNIDMPKTVEPTKHIYHLQPEDEPKPRALLAVLELHQPKNALVACDDAAECEFLSRYLARFGYKVKLSSSEANAQGVVAGLSELQQGQLDIFIVQTELLSQANLEKVPFLILYNMIEQPKDYESITQLAKKSSDVDRKVVSILASRELGCLGPIKAQCLIDISEQALPNEEAVNELCAKRIAAALNQEASQVELAQYEVLAKHMLSLDSSTAVLSLLLKNYLASLAKVEERRAPSSRSQGYQREPRPPRHHEERERTPRSAPAEPSGPQKSADGITRIYVTLGRQDGLQDLASLAQYLSEKSGVDLGHFSGSGMLRDTSAHIEVDDDVADQLISAVHNSEKPANDKLDGGAEKVLVVCERAHNSQANKFRRPPPRGRRQNFSRR